MNTLVGIFDRSLVAQFLTVALTAGYFFAFFFAATRVKKKRLDRDADLKRAITNGLVNDQIEGVDDLVNIYRGVTNSNDDDVSYQAGVSRVLRQLLVKLASDPESLDSKRLLRRKIKTLLAQIEQQTPFAEMPAAERNLIIDAQNFIEKNELTAARHKINDLAGLIEARQDAYVKLQSANKWSVPLAVVGLVLTVVFGVPSLWGLFK